MNELNKHWDKIKILANKEKNYNWINGNNFLGQNGTRKKLIPIGMDKNTSKNNLLIFKKIADKHKLTFWLICGTLLGAVREKDFIDYDNDTDIKIYFKDIPLLVKCVPELMKLGLNPLRISKNEISFMKDNEYIDIEFLHNPTKYTKEFDKIKFLDEEFNIPKYIDEYLTIMYGDWRTPCKKHSWIVPGL